MTDDKLVEIPRFTIQGLSLTMEGGTKKPDWISAGQRLAQFHRASTFLIGDWYLAGVFAGFTRGDLYDDAEKITGLDRETLQNAVWLSNSVTPERRNSDLSPSHHKEVAALDPLQQVKMLEQAATNHWSKRELHDHVQGKLPAPLRAPTPEKVTLGEELIAWADKARKYDEFKEVVAAADKLFTTGSRTIFPK